MRHGGKVLAGGAAVVLGGCFWVLNSASKWAENNPTLQREMKIGDCLRGQGVAGGSFDRFGDGEYGLFQENDMVKNGKTVFVYKIPSGRISSHSLLRGTDTEINDPTPVERETLKALKSCAAASGLHLGN